MTLREIIEALWAGHVPKKPLNGKGERYSASTVKQVKQCERRHWFEQVIGIEPPPTPALGIGTKVHGFKERYYKQGKIPRLSPDASMEEKLAAKGLPLLPPTGTPGILSEHEFTMATWPGGPNFTGTMDLVLPPAGFDPDGDEDYDFAELWDYKTTGNYARYSAKGWALSALPAHGKREPNRSYLVDDVQNIAYSRRVHLKWRVKEVRAKWVYYDKSGGPCVAVPAVMERAETGEKWRELVLPSVEVMHRQHKERPSLATVPMNEEACDSYGGCPHRAYCVDYKEKEKVMGKLSQQILSGHSEAKVEKSTTKKAKEDDAPALNPPPPKGKLAAQVATEESPFATMDKKEPKAEATKAEATKAETSSPKSSKASSESQESPKESPTTKSTPSAGGGFALFLGCEPVISKRPAVRLATILAPLEERVAKANKVAHVGLVKYDAVHHTAAALEEWLQENGDELNGSNVIVGKSAFHQDIAERVLYAKAIAVAVGVS